MESPGAAGYQAAAPSVAAVSGAGAVQPPAVPIWPAAAELPVFEKDGWRLEAESKPLWGTERVDALIKERKLCGCDGMPDMFCGDSAVHFRHAASGTLLELSASDAFRCCSWRPLPPAALHPPRQSDDAGEDSTPLLGTVRCQFAAKWRPKRENPDVKEMDVNSDWTCSSPYWGSLSRSSTASAASLETKGMEVETDEPLPLELLQRRDDILWFNDVLLWEDELSDNGLCRMSVKVRVMPTFWFALMLCELRVDNVLLREVGTRLFCSFGTDRILREWTWKEATYEELHKRGMKVADNPQITGENVGTSLLGPQDVKRQLRHYIYLGGSVPAAAAATDDGSGSRGADESKPP